VAKPRLFIGSSKKNVRVAQLLASSLNDCAQVEIWNQGFFGIGDGYLESLVKNLEDYDFAAFILAPDDMTLSGDESRPAPRDNVLFESGLFMGVLGRDRVFLVVDPSAQLEIPSDLAGITLAHYDGTRVRGNDTGAVNDAYLAISERIEASRFPFLVGEWKSEYSMTFEEGYPTVVEEMYVRTSGDCLSLVTKISSHDDFYTAWGRIVIDRQIIGKWKSHPGKNNMEGVFMLTFSPNANYMYGYFTSPDEKGGIVYATWVLAKMTDADEAEVNERMRKARTLLKGITILGPAIPPALGN
jgi:hypothetical protein